MYIKCHLRNISNNCFISQILFATWFFFSLLPNFSRKKNLESRRLWLWISLDATRTGDIPPNSGTSRGLEKRLRVLQKKTAAGPFWYPEDIAKDERILPKPSTRGVPGVCAVRVCWNVFFVYWGLKGTFCPDHQLWLDFATAIFHLTHSMIFWKFPLKGPATDSRRWWKEMVKNCWICAEVSFFNHCCAGLSNATWTWNLGFFNGREVTCQQSKMFQGWHSQGSLARIQSQVALMYTPEN